jgi:hypothetical protein
LITEGAFVDVVATLKTQIRKKKKKSKTQAKKTYLNNPFKKTGLKPFSVVCLSSSFERLFTIHSLIINLLLLSLLSQIGRLMPGKKMFSKRFK